MSQERRHYSRVNFDHEAYLHSAGERYECQLLDVSLKGVLVEVSEDFPAQSGQKAMVEVQLAGTAVQIQADSTLVFKKDNQCGFRFDEIGIDSLTHLRRLLELNTGDSDLVRKELFFIVNDSTNG
ncbi:MAG: hypothetical protein A2508_00330 [Candidatus Lambdaproteobacteria bacterium RIFOXYD12_FULL_49_8]|uniref:Cyclic diguanosine monophosphate-binding protein n=1 Tax=Candidatus Lambdaproteobacteria bacterium RIFOXYD2_FULL_50_16 TaxID=1817772 RepID=A0A1F6GDZ9_9PROT|nr:MAG: hypothetical protein A2527_02390 [Candidatus Lambdaproteobacteria bacterium RIFOXYD2_FULL_50_16]OGG98251.1 MAG: hypothetical protein A2508_00330 [Candidatus Lambdaproteobacteria bacterium RIFOXYD12_FULL_49_8]